MSLEDALITRDILRDFSKHPIDITLLNISVSHGVIYLRGRLQKIRGHEEMNLEEELHTIMKALRQKNGIRDVVSEIDLRDFSTSNKKKKALKY